MATHESGSGASGVRTFSDVVHFEVQIISILSSCCVVRRRPVAGLFSRVVSLLTNPTQLQENTVKTKINRFDIRYDMDIFAFKNACDVVKHEYSSWGWFQVERIEESALVFFEVAVRRRVALRARPHCRRRDSDLGQLSRR